MKSVSIAVAVSLLLGVAAPAQADSTCVYPQPPQSYPDGAKATKDEMLTGQAAVKDYAKSVQETYLPCLEKEKQEAIGALDPAADGYAEKKLTLEEIHSKKHNVALDELTAVADRWKEEIAEFNGKGNK